MKSRIILAAMISALWVKAEDFSLKYFAAGPIALHTSLSYEGKGERLTATAVNQSGVPVEYFKICVEHAKVKGCLFTLWTQEALPPNGKIEWTLTSPRKLPELSHSATILEFRQPALPPAPRTPSKFDPVHKIYVEELGGNTGPILREQIIAAIVNSGRFSAVEIVTSADAVLHGRSDSLDDATKVTTSGHGSGGAIGGVVITGGKSSSVTQRVVTEIDTLRLTVPSGDVIWAWDGAGPCALTKARCAIENLTTAARQ
jgi:hypothetical protein